MKKKKLSRRLFVKNLGIALTLPGFESLLGLSETAFAQAMNKKFIGCFFPNGSLSMIDTPLGRGDGIWRFGNNGVLEEIEVGNRNNIMVVRGLSLRAPRDQHLFGTAGFLSGSLPQTGRNQNGFNLRCARSVDQMIADQLNSQNMPTHHSLQLGYQYRGHPAFNSSAHQHYINAISWRTATTPILPNYSPKSVFDLIFAPFAPEAAKAYIASRNKSILDFVMEETQEITNKLSVRDKVQMDLFLTQVRELEKSMEPVNDSACPEAPSASAYQRTSNYVQHIQQMQTLMVLAMKCDLTHVGTIMYNNGTGDPWANNHAVAHRSVEPGGSRDTSNMMSGNRTYINHFNSLINLLKEHQLIDNTIAFCSSNMAHGFHGDRNIPTLLAGNMNGFSWGREVGRFDRPVPQASLLIEIAREYGVNLNTLGHNGNQGRAGQIQIRS